MAYLVIDGSTVPVAAGGVKLVWEKGGEFSRAHDGTMRSSVRWRKRKWTVESNWMRSTDGYALVNVWVSSTTVPFTASGDFASTNVPVHLDDFGFTREVPRPSSAGSTSPASWVKLAFMMYEQ